MITREYLYQRIDELNAKEAELLGQANAIVGAKNMCQELLTYLDFSEARTDDTLRAEDRVY